MSLAAARVAPRAVRIDLAVEFNWRRSDAGAATIWFAGHCYGDGEARLRRAAQAGDAAALIRLLPELDGHFACAIDAGAFVLAATDPIASIPLFIAETDDPAQRHAVDARAPRLAARCGLATPDADAVRELAMAGFTIGDRTLYRGLTQMRPGEYALWRGADLERRRYHIYRPWRVRERPAKMLHAELAELLDTLFRKLAGDLGGRMAVIPLSAGLDSRLIAAGLRHAGYRNVRCFAYGKPGNFEAEASRRIAGKLGYDWRFVATTPASQRAFFASTIAAEFKSFADTLAGIPFQQDYDALRRLAESGFVPRDAVVINGQSGDYITGNHIPEKLSVPAPEGTSDDERWQRILDAAVAKHFALWRHLMTPDNVARVQKRLRHELREIGAALGAPALDYALYEQSEYDHRQARYVVQGQRSYEHQGYDWRMPLWDRALIDFFEAAPLSAKRAQALYRETLEALDWGGVWRGIAVNRKTIRPLWLAFARMLAKFAIAPRGRAAWHDVERRWFAYPMDNLSSYAAVPYASVRRDRRGFRNAFSWHVEAYLAAKGIPLDAAIGAAEAS
ncbi:MAG: asparagine synthase-related protein [Alphaproteobacteria bacterium]